MKLILSAMWLRVDVTHWIAGVLGGLTAMAVLLGFATIKTGNFLAVLKMPAVICNGGQAMASDSGVGMAIYGGIIFYFVLASVLGLVFAHT